MYMLGCWHTECTSQKSNCKDTHRNILTAAMLLTTDYGVRIRALSKLQFPEVVNETDLDRGGVL